MANKTQLVVAEPLYRKAERALTDRILTRTWLPGERIPNEFALAAEFGVSQGTMRKALTSMEERGLLVRSPGRGTIVARTTEAEALYAFFRLRDEAGDLIVPEPLSEEIAVRAASPAEREALGKAGDTVYEIRRVRQHAGAPVALELMVLPAEHCAGLEADAPLPNSLYPYLEERFGIAVMRARERVGAVLAGKEEAARLAVPAGTPLLEVSRRAYDLAGRLVELRVSKYVTSNGRYQVDLTRAAPPDE